MIQEIVELALGRIEPVFVHPGVRTQRFADKLRDRSLLGATDTVWLSQFQGSKEWLKKWSGNVPDGWGDRVTVHEDLAKARRLRVQLPTEWIESLIDHPDRFVTVKVAASQVLESEMYWHGLRRLKVSWQRLHYDNGQEELTGVGHAR